MCQISPFILVKQHQGCSKADIKHFTGDRIYCSATSILVKLAHWGGYDTEKQQKEKTKAKSITLIPNSFWPSSTREGQIKMYLFYRTKSLLGATHQKLKILPPNKSPYFRIKHIFPQSRLLHLLPNIWFLCNFVQKLLAPTTIRTKLQEYWLDLISGVRHPSISSLSILQSSYSLSVQTSVACWKPRG